MRIWKKLAAVMCLMLAVGCCSTAMAEVGQEVVRPVDVDSGYWVNAYSDYIEAHSYYWTGDTSSTDPFIKFADIDLDGIPELFALTEWGRWSNSGWVVKITSAGVVEFYSDELFQSTSNIALCVDDDGNYGWYEETFSAGTGLQYTTVNRLSVNTNMEIVHHEWFRYGTEQVFNEETGDVDFVNTGYWVEGQQVEYDVYRKEEIKRHRLRVLYSNDTWFSYPQDWDAAINEYCVCNAAQ